ncbi:MAG: reverse transcriptase domain-containing protein [Sedimenticola sp.]
MFFSSHIGLRQGEKLSPVPFALFLNDMEDYLEIHSCQGIKVQLNSPDFTVYLKILLLLYADDTAILADNTVDFPRNLDYFYSNCKKWKLNVNFTKTKIVVFGARKTTRFNFKLGGNTLEITDDYKYLGIFFSKT